MVYIFRFSPRFVFVFVAGHLLEFLITRPSQQLRDARARLAEGAWTAVSPMAWEVSLVERAKVKSVNVAETKREGIHGEVGRASEEEKNAFVWM